VPGDIIASSLERERGIPAVEQCNTARAMVSVPGHEDGTRRPRAGWLERLGIGPVPDMGLGIGFEWLGRLWGFLGAWLPKGLYIRALIIIIAPMALLQSVIAFVFMERHWESVTRRLSEATAGQIGAVIEMYEDYAVDDDYRRLVQTARSKLGLSLQVLPPGDLPAPRPKPFFDLLDRTLSTEIRRHVRYPIWVDTVGRSRHVEIQIQLPEHVLRFVAKRSQTYASNSHIFLLWMVGTSLVLLTVAIAFLRNQIRPILRLADAADAFGKGRPVPEDFRPRGAREVRPAAFAFLEMRDRIEKHVEQRTTMLAGVSHDLRTILTRFNLQLAMMRDPRADALKDDVAEMQAMLQDYMAFTKGDAGEETAPHDIRDLLAEVASEMQHTGKHIQVAHKLKRPEKMIVPLKRHAFRRAVSNLVSNASRYGETIAITTNLDTRWLRIEIEDDGPGIPPEQREDAFRPFTRLDEGRNQDQGHTGLGLAIARDIARAHGGDIWLDKSQLGGLKAVVRVPV